MPLAKFQVSVLSPLQKLGEYSAWEVRVPSHHGEMGVRAHHTPFVGALGVGVVKLQTEEHSPHTLQRFVVCGGFFEVQGHTLTFLVDHWEDSASIDYGRAAESRKRALERLKSQDPHINISRALASLKRAETRLSLQEHRNPPSTVSPQQTPDPSFEDRPQAVNM